LEKAYFMYGLLSLLRNTDAAMNRCQWEEIRKVCYANFLVTGRTLRK
jgi:hypothetical protein